MIRIRIICLKIRTFHELLKYNFTSSPEKCVRHPHLLCISHCQVADFIWNTSVNKYFGRYSISLNNFINEKCSYGVISLIGTPLKMSLDCHPPNLLGLAPPKLCWNHFQVHVFRGCKFEHLNFFERGGVPVWDPKVFLKSVTYWPHWANSGGCQLKKSPCRMFSRKGIFY